jgi:hypothetical protein
MLDPDVVLSSVVASLQSIPQLATELGAPEIPATESITGHYFFSGEDNSYIRTLAQMKSPSILVAYLDFIMGNFDGMTVWKHRLNLCVRSRNKASNGGAASAQHLWWMAMNLPISVPEVAPNIRYVDLAFGNLWLFETNLKYQTDELGQDFFIGTMVFNEMGDAGPDSTEFLCIGPSSIRVAPTLAGFAEAIRQHLPAEEQRELLQQIEQGVQQGASNGVTHTK